MKIIVFFVVFSFFPILFPSIKIHASSEQAYKDYLYQSDVYREKYNEFSIAKNEYLKFKTLLSETTMVFKTREMMSQRALLLKAYLMFLKEKLNETGSMNENDKMSFQSMIDNEIAFLENHSKFVTSIASTKDIIKTNNDLESHYLIFSTSIRQIILALTESRLTELGNTYSGIMINMQILLNEAKKELPNNQHIFLDRWLQRISDKRTLFLEKLQNIQIARTTLKAQKMEDLEKKFKEVLVIVPHAQQELKDGTLYIKELLNAIKYQDSLYE